MNVVGMRRWAGASPPGSSGRLLQQLDNFLYDGVDHPIRLQHRAVPGDTTFQTAYFELDLTGNVRRLRGTTGEDLGGYRYTAFGKAYPSDATTPAAQVDQPLRWKGRWFNVLTGLYDVRARLWSPELGVFVSADELEYVGGSDPTRTLWNWPGQNPFLWSDPMGRDWIAAAQSFGAGFLSGAAGYVIVSAGIASGTVAGAAAAVATAGVGAFSVTATAIEIATGEDYWTFHALSAEQRWDRVAELTGGLVGGGLAERGTEISFGPNFRLAPFGNRTGNPTGELPHYHRRVIDPRTGKPFEGQGIKRHRPWDTKSSDDCPGDRF